MNQPFNMNQPRIIAANHTGKNHDNEPELQALIERQGFPFHHCLLFLIGLPPAG